MKHCLLVGLLPLLIFISCLGGGKQIVYKFENNGGAFKFSCTNEDTNITNSVNFSSYELYESKDDSIEIHFIYSEHLPNVQKLLSIEPVLMATDENGNYHTLPGTSYVQIEYFDGNNIIRQNKENKNLVLNKIIDWGKVNYTYEFVGKQYTMDNNTVTFTFDNNFRLDKKPETLKLKVIFKWENGERTYESVLTKTDYIGRKLNPKF